MNHKKNMGLLVEVANYYAEKVIKHGDTPLGVDWNSAEGQALRFEQLCRVLPSANDFSLNDLGCGYGALLDYLLDRDQNYVYLGVDVSPEMIRAASQNHSASPRARFINSAEPDQVADYGIASGIFNVRQGRSNAEWYAYLQSTLDILDRTSSLGFSFNCLSLYSDKDKRRDYLYYADPCKLFDLCKQRYSKNVSLLHDYGLYEFTIVVRKDL